MTVFNVFFVRALAQRLHPGGPTVIINTVAPGYCESELRRNLTEEDLAQLAPFEQHKWTAEEGTRSILFATLSTGSVRLQGKFINQSTQVEGGSDFMDGEVGLMTQDALWVCVTVPLLARLRVSPRTFMY
jgi:NAD(P)-dependent dehydrogenase (short-subunit alcohol dehydrogenase family)